MSDLSCKGVETPACYFHPLLKEILIRLMGNDLMESVGQYTRTLLHANTFTYRRFYTQTLLHSDTFTHRRFSTQTFTHRRSQSAAPLGDLSCKQRCANIVAMEMLKNRKSAQDQAQYHDQRTIQCKASAL